LGTLKLVAARIARRTKIVCTLGPAVDSKVKVKALIDGGMNVARLNCSHGDWEAKRQWIEWVRELSPRLAPVAILADLQGPKFRLGILPNGDHVVEAGTVHLVGDNKQVEIPIHQHEILHAFSSGAHLLLGDGNVELKLISESNGIWKAKAVSGGLVKSKQGVTLRGKVFQVPCMTPKDRADIAEACQAGADYIALSYVKSSRDYDVLRDEVDRYEPRMRLCAKIETHEALHDLEAIVRKFDLVMVARGDMGLQMDIEEVPMAQKRIISVANRIGKPVITATQMLESMMSSPRPTRAEATDVANAILDGTDAVMLSGETAAGEYPIECVKTMARLAERAERIFDRDRLDRDFKVRLRKSVDHTEAVAHSVSRLASLLDVDAIVTTSTSGQTARVVSKFRPDKPILCATWDERVQRQLAVVWGVEALRVPLPVGTDDAVRKALLAFVKVKRLKRGQSVIVTAGVPVGKPGHTNLIMTLLVEEPEDFQVT
jgi:pyruvate kinase